MKDFIHNKLKLILEGVYASKKQLQKFRHKIAAHKIKFPEPYFNDITIGDGIYVVRFNRYGNSSAPPKRGHASTLNTRKGDRGGDSVEDYITFNIKAYRGVDHEGTYKERTGDAKTRGGERVKDGEIGDPFSDAVIKAINVHGKEILGFMEEVKYTDGDSGEKRAIDIMGKDEVEKQRKRLDFKTKKDTVDITTDDELGTLVDRRQELVSRKLKARGDERKALIVKIKKLDADIKKLEKDSSWKANVRK